MKAGYLGVLVILLGVFMLGMTTLPWADVTMADPAPEGIELPDQVVEFTGVDLQPGSVPSALLTMAAGVFLVLVAPAGRVFATTGRTVMIAAASVIMVSAVAAFLLAPRPETIQFATLGGVGDPVPGPRPAIGGFYLAMLAAVLLCGLAWRVRRPPVVVDTSSSYTVEAVQAGVSEDDEWDMAEADTPHIDPKDPQ